MKMNPFFAGIVLLFCCLQNSVMAQPYTPILKVSVNGGSTWAIHTSGSSYSTNSLTFSLDYPSVPTDHKPPLEVFWEFGDGHYGWTDTVAHTFASTAPSSIIKVWTIDKYDDDEPPPKSYDFPISFTPGAAAPRDATGHKIEILPSWLPSADDSIIYIIRVHNSCQAALIGQLNFHFDAPKVVLSSFVSNNINFNPSAGTGMVSWGSVDVPIGTFVDYYVRFKLKSTITPGSNFNVSADFAVDTERCPQPTGSESPSKTVDSHDPNNKLVLKPEIICMDQSGSQLTIHYRINYQNIGDGAADYVTIEDWLDQKDEVIDVVFTGSKHSPSGSPFKDLTKGYLRWHFEYPNTTGLLTNVLNGTQQIGYVTTFPDDHTRGWVEFEVHYNTSVLIPCNALMNQARITFDCNKE
jgi:hypothetical protein